MRRLLEVGSISTLALAAFVGIAGKAEAQSTPANQVDVIVDIRCLAGNGVSFSLVPWSARLAVGDSSHQIVQLGGCLLRRLSRTRLGSHGVGKRLARIL